MKSADRSKKNFDEKSKKLKHAATKVLLIEDNFEIRENITEILQLDNYEVITAPNGRTGLELAKEKLPDIILCDIKMPGFSGYDVIAQLKKDPKTCSILFIFITSSVGKKEVQSALELGADGYIFKPFGLQELLNEIDRCLTNKGLFQSTDLLTGDRASLNQ